MFGPWAMKPEKLVLYNSREGNKLQVVGAFLERQMLNKNRGGALCTGADGPRPRAGRSAAWCEARRCSLHRGGRSARRGRTVRGLVRGAVVLSAQGRTVRGLVRG